MQRSSALLFMVTHTEPLALLRSYSCDAKGLRVRQRVARGTGARLVELREEAAFLQARHDRALSGASHTHGQATRTAGRGVHVERDVRGRRRLTP